MYATGVAVHHNPRWLSCNCPESSLWLNVEGSQVSQDERADDEFLRRWVATVALHHTKLIPSLSHTFSLSFSFRGKKGEGEVGRRHGRGMWTKPKDLECYSNRCHEPNEESNTKSEDSDEFETDSLNEESNEEESSKNKKKKANDKKSKSKGRAGKDKKKKL